ncbi:hypothetical protein VOLCADRAFT_86011 [Volvox carteri f. nagariensis]|uniref:Uncharacterized protein n=1 Tax=Volvox carteri f. nagariensis TaxID=3068 RepID=D8THL3_VOLCA|nr:uncharacterized protein VOLCADRAFT_86011 [Volvox carteri f. nagariensis]EFJ52731.1 hypothetical protein VOLCADRAFT_86011 [Volvox carteri f. nagariensis]|eukprot:XP_002945736.1 hypothetical protein VOLCADRAFT_86011 [Volvox carteri f. nagariensis]
MEAQFSDEEFSDILGAFAEVDDMLIGWDVLMTPLQGIWEQPKDAPMPYLVQTPSSSQAADPSNGATASGSTARGSMDASTAGGGGGGALTATGSGAAASMSNLSGTSGGASIRWAAGTLVTTSASGTVVWAPVAHLPPLSMTDPSDSIPPITATTTTPATATATATATSHQTHMQLTPSQASTAPLGRHSEHQPIMSLARAAIITQGPQTAPLPAGFEPGPSRDRASQERSGLALGLGFGIGPSANPANLSQVQAPLSPAAASVLAAPAAPFAAQASGGRVPICGGGGTGASCPTATNYLTTTMPTTLPTAADVTADTIRIRGHVRRAAELKAQLATRVRAIQRLAAENADLRGRAKVLELVVRCRDEQLRLLRNYRTSANGRVYYVEQPGLLLLGEGATGAAANGVAVAAVGGGQSGGEGGDSPGAMVPYVGVNAAALAVMSAEGLLEVFRKLIHDVSLSLSEAAAPAPLGSAAAAADTGNGYDSAAAAAASSSGPLARLRDQMASFRNVLRYLGLVNEAACKFVDTNLTGKPGAPEPGHWLRVIQELHLSPQQLADAAALQSCWQDWLSRIHVERRDIAAALDQLLSVNRYGATYFESVGRYGTDRDVIHKMHANVMRERILLVLTGEVFCCHILTDIQWARAIVKSYPYILDVRELVCAASQLYYSSVRGLMAPPLSPYLCLYISLSSFFCLLVKDSYSCSGLRDGHAAHRTVVPLHGVRAARSERVQVPLFTQRRSTRLQCGSIALALAFWPPGTFTFHPHPSSVTTTPTSSPQGNAFTSAPVTTPALGQPGAGSAPAADDEVGGKSGAMGPSMPLETVCLGLPVAAGHFPFTAAVARVPVYQVPHSGHRRAQQDSSSRDGAQGELCAMRGMRDEGLGAVAEAGVPTQPQPQPQLLQQQQQQQQSAKKVVL